MTNSTQNSEALEAKIEYNFPYPCEKVFAAWLDPKILGTWMFGPAIRDEEVISIDVDPKVGGEFSFLVRRGATVIDHIGSYLKIEKPTRLEFNWGVKGMSDSSRVIVDIRPNSSGCTLTLVHELHPAWIDYLERSKEGWSEMMVALDKALKKK